MHIDYQSLAIRQMWRLHPLERLVVRLRKRFCTHIVATLFAMGAASLPAPVARGGTFQGLGDLSGGAFESLVSAISADGSTVVGSAVGERGREAFRWTRQGGMIGLGDLIEGYFESHANSVSADGSVIVGYGYSAEGMEAFRWSSSNGMSGLGDFLDDGKTSSTAMSVSNDGSIIVGTGNFSRGGGPAPVTGRAFQWTAANGLVPLQDLPGDPDCSRANAVAPNGLSIVGTANCDASFQVEDMGQAARFYLDQPAQLLAQKPDPLRQGTANSVSNSQITVGAQSEFDDGLHPRRATRWMATGESEVLTANFAEEVASEALDLAHESDGAWGARVVGWTMNGQGNSSAFIWDPVHGAVTLDTILLAFGLGKQSTDWKLEQAVSISADGKTVVGTGFNPQGQRESWIAELSLETPGDFQHDGHLDATDIDLLTRAVVSGAHPFAFDVNDDIFVSLEDRRVWVEQLKHTYFGDANLDGVFSSTDFVMIFQAGKYEDAIADNTLWSEGDWNGDLDFDSSDLVFAFQQGDYEKGPRPAIAFVPEPSDLIHVAGSLLVIGPIARGVKRRRT